MIEEIVQEIAEEIAEKIADEILVVEPDKLELAYVIDGPEGGEPVILVHGLGQTIADWPDAFIASLAAQGLRLVRLDNRDVGKSTRFDQHGEPALFLQWLTGVVGLKNLAPPPYTLVTMAADVLALMDGLGIRRAHLIGVSMGGMIVQHVAAQAPDRVSSLTCIMSSSGAPGLPRPREDVEAALAGSATPDLADTLAFRRLVAGPLSAADETELAERVATSFAYGAPLAAGVPRQYAAIIADGDRYRRLADLRVPSLVIHGEDDPFVRPEHGIDLADRISHAKRILLPRMGHEITASLAPILARIVGDHIRAHANL